MTTLKAYSHYKYSGINWIGQIPAAWTVQRFRTVFRESAEVNGAQPIGTMLSISSYRGVEEKLYDDDGRRRTAEESLGYRVVRPGQLAVNTMWLNHGGLGVSEVEGHVSPAYRAYWIDQSFDKRYLHHLMRSSVYIDGYTALLTGIRPNSLQMSRDNLMDFPVLRPPRKDQAGIAAFLDRETAEIDAFIADQEKLIALLAERRAATISHAVTRGLDPSVLLKDSGVEWLGEIPEHWTVMPFGRAVKFREGPGIALADFCDEGVPLLRVAGLGGRFASLAGCNYLDPRKVEVRWRQFLIEEGDLLISASASMGKVAEAGRDVVGAVPYTGIIRMSPRSELEKHFLRFFLQSTIFAAQVNRLKTGSTIQHYGPEHLRQMRLALPSRDEQLRIAHALERETADLDAAIADAREAVALSSERRAAFISAAVTGKIDVRAAA